MESSWQTKLHMTVSRRPARVDEIFSAHFVSARPGDACKQG